MCPDPPDGFVFPVAEYDHRQGASVTGGYVYRGCALPDLRGTYFYGDWASGFVRSFEWVGGVAQNERDWSSQIVPDQAPERNWLASFGEDARGELYILDRNTGEVMQIVAEEP